MPYIAFDPATAAAAPASTVGAPLTSTGLTFLDYQNRLQFELGNRADVTLPLRKQWINDAYKYVCGVLKLQQFKGTISMPTVIAQPLYKLPTNVRTISRANVIDTSTYPVEGGRKLTLIEEHQYRLQPDASDEPVSYFRYNQMIVLYPTPNNVRTVILEVIARPADLVNDTDSPLVPQEFHEALFLRAKSVGFRALRQWTEATMSQNDFVDTMRSLRDAEADDEEDKIAGFQPIRRQRQTYRRDDGQDW